MQKPICVLVFSLLLACLCGCVSTLTPTPVPTQPLRMATSTPTMLPATPTPTPEDLPSAFEINAAAATPVHSLVPLLAGDASLDEVFLSQMQSDLAERTTIPTERILLGRIVPDTWTDADLGCTSSVGSGSFERERTGYVVTWLIGDSVYTYHTEREDRYVLCPGSEIAQDDLLLAVDLIANDLLGLAKRRLARELDLPQERVRLVNIVPVTWQDTSLGCPQPDTHYASADLRGYRIEVAVGNETYIYHTDDSRLIACSADLEQLPPGLLNR
ncbi:hypothetical protein G4Y79_12825 [Phototrophicus methaneseepsis]|uniref:Uncharacterized protein n=1 Tax=Phototrophicus methaneseepsis TaxID=2710758 RepID=A0A7S8ICL2_9CHLR|nr:hypothetical protein [Phototrophicus methaneseepsis]QPC80596.1 hypothetical protein G4Y79_12825 [Phototrophicus methaneseepsis]